MQRDTALALDASCSSEDLDATPSGRDPLVPPFRRCSSDSPETPRVSVSAASLQDILKERAALVSRALEASRGSGGSSDDGAEPSQGDELNEASPVEAFVPEMSEDKASEHRGPVNADARVSGSPAEAPDAPALVSDGVQVGLGFNTGTETPSKGRVEGEIQDAARQAEPEWASPSEMSPAIRQLLQPSHVQEARCSTAAPLTSARPTGQGTLEQYANLRRKLWRPPDLETVAAAIPDIGMPSDRSGYVSDASQNSSPAGASRHGTDAPVSAVKQRCAAALLHHILQLR